MVDQVDVWKVLKVWQIRISKNSQEKYSRDFNDQVTCFNRNYDQISGYGAARIRITMIGTILEEVIDG